MNTNYNIKNFRAFGNDGATVKIAPITILTGCNSSGKSSITKSLLLLDTFLSKVKMAITSKSNIDLGECTLDFNEYPLNLLGRFDKVVNVNSNSKEIEFKYTSQKGLDVVLTFYTKESDVLNRGYLKKLEIFKDDINIFSTEDGSFILNMQPFIDEYFKKTKKYLTKGIFTSYDQAEYWASHNVSTETINWAIENNSFFRVPILEKIGHLRRNNFQEEINAIYSSKYTQIEGLEVLLNRLSLVFFNSDCETFAEFFNSREKLWLSQISHEEILRDEDKRLQVPMLWSSIDINYCKTDKFIETLLDLIAKGNPKVIDLLNNTKFRFPNLLTTLNYIGHIIDISENEKYCKRITLTQIDGTYNTVTYPICDDFKRYVIRQLDDALSPSWSGALAYVGSSRVDVKRLYTLDAQTDFALLLNRYFNARRDFAELPKVDNEEGYIPDSFMNKWLKNFGIADTVSIEMDSEGLGISIKLHKGNRTSLLADEGYGITQLFSILLEIETEIQQAFRHFIVKGWLGQNYVFETDMKTNKVLFPEQTIIIEEPEIHLHPKYQSLLLDMFAEACKQFNIHFIIETHSEYLIRRLQVRVAENNIPAENVSVIYVDENSNPYNMGLAQNGKFSQDFGSGFFDEADNAAIQLFELTED
ncbi:MAG: AAA family ATPase [Muribaculaceae bacterium]|nr:AAA family ATPase [Muribaculaceae bacterium]